MRSRGIITLVLAGTVLAGCAGNGATGPASPSTSEGSTRRNFGIDTWFAARPGAGPAEVVLSFEGPDGPPDNPCQGVRDVAVETTATEVRATVRRFEPSAVMTCDDVPGTITATLPEPLGDRALVNPVTGWRFRAAGAGLALDPDSTPCAREDCSTPSALKATCDPAEYEAVVSEQVLVGTATTEDPRCDGSFLVLSRKGRRAWFVNRQGGWRLVATDLRACDDVWRTQRIRFPAALCA
jgi:hypothetical protein